MEGAERPAATGGKTWGCMGDTAPHRPSGKMLGEGEYVAGLEPCNAKCENRARLRERGAPRYLEPGGIVEIEMEIGVLEGRIEIETFAFQVREILDRDHV